MCHGDAMDCISDGRYHGAQYLRGMAAKMCTVGEDTNSEETAGVTAALEIAGKLEKAARELEKESDILCKEMVPILGGWGRSEAQVRKLAEPETRRIFAGQIERMKKHEQRAQKLLQEAFELLE